MRVSLHKMNQWGLLSVVVTLFIVSLLTTFVFCFWYVYLLDVIRRKWKFYKNEFRCLQQGASDIQQQTLAYNAKTEFVKNILLFFLNQTEWMAFIFARIGNILFFTLEFYHDEINHYHSLHFNVFSFISVFNITTVEINIEFSVFSFLFLTNICFVMSLILVASLCMYLSARIAQTSWIKSNKIPHLIFFFLLCCIINQLLAVFCSTQIIADWFAALLVITSFCIALKQYMKLQMVINWKIVDLGICHDKRSMMKQIRIKRKFTRLFTLISTGIFLLSSSQLLNTFIRTLMLILREKDNTNFDISLCKKSIFTLPMDNYIFWLLFRVIFAIEMLGNLFIFIPYVCDGLSTMYLMMWRLCKGRTGFKTHFHNEIHAPLILRST